MHQGFSWGGRAGGGGEGRRRRYLPLPFEISLVTRTRALSSFSPSPLSHKKTTKKTTKKKQNPQAPPIISLSISLLKYKNKIGLSLSVLKHKLVYTLPRQIHSSHPAPRKTTNRSVLTVVFRIIQEASTGQIINPCYRTLTYFLPATQEAPLFCSHLSYTSSKFKKNHFTYRTQLLPGYLDLQLRWEKRIYKVRLKSPLDFTVDTSSTTLPENSVYASVGVQQKQLECGRGQRKKHVTIITAHVMTVEV